MLLGPRRRGDEAEILLQQHDDLIHIQAEIRYRLPVRQMIIRDELIPPLQLVGKMTQLTRKTCNEYLDAGNLICYIM